MAALYRAADVAIVTPVRDGLNLVAIEYSVINHDRDWELILGTGAGAYETIGHYCRGVDANDVIAIADAIRQALTPDAQRAETANRRAAAAAQLDSADWVRRCMAHFLPRTESPTRAPDPSCPELFPEAAGCHEDDRDR